MEYQKVVNILNILNILNSNRADIGQIPTLTSDLHNAQFAHKHGNNFINKNGSFARANDDRFNIDRSDTITKNSTSDEEESE